MNKLSSEEAVLLDKLHDILNKERKKRFNRQDLFYQTTLTGEMIPSKPENAEGYSLDSFTFNIYNISQQLGLTKQSFEFQISNLIALGLLKWETDVEVSAERSSYDPENKEIDVSVDVYNNNDFIFTPLGDRFVKICEFK